MNKHDRIYLSLPIPLQQLAVAAYGLGWYKRRFSKHFHQYVSEFKNRESWNETQFRAYQEDRLKKILMVAANSTYYQEIFSQNGLQPEEIDLSGINKVPFLTKDTLREKYRDLLTTTSIPRGTIIQKSSGTTGTPSFIYYTKEFHALELAVSEARNLNWAGVNYRDRRVMFGVRKVCAFDQNKPPFWRYSPVENMAYGSIYHLSPKFLPFYLEFLHSYQPSIIMGYPSALFSIAKFSLDNNDFPPPAKAVITMAETLDERARQVIEQVWKTKIFDRYGAVEGCVFASQCEYGNYHVSPEIGFIEIIDKDGNPCPPGVMGEVICTGLQNTLQPLIRYRIGDVARWALDQKCKCHRQMPILERIEGRYEDLCLTSDGREILRFDTVFKGITSIKEAQIVQQAIDHFDVFVVPTVGFSQNDIEKIRNNMKSHVGDCNIQVKTMQQIERDPSGKFRAVKSNVKRDLL